MGAYSMKFRSFSTVSLLLVVVCCVLTVFGKGLDRSVDREEEDDALSNQRELREYDQESWHAIHNTPEGASGWIPRDPTESRPGIVYTKRRRLRKRKRRPPVVSVADEGLEDVLRPTKIVETENYKQVTVAPVDDAFGDEKEFTKPKRRKRPNVREPWEEMQEESVRPYVRRKITPAYETSEEMGIITSSSVNLGTLGASLQFGSSSETHANQNAEKSKKKEESNVETNENSKTERPTTSKTPNLKAILKQNGGLSLSEILQRKNLTLSQLLTGNQEAIQALTKSSEDIPSTTTSSSINLLENVISSTHKSPTFSENVESKYTRLPPSVALKKNINRKFEQYGESHESLSDKELLEAQRKRFALLQGHSYKTAQGKFSEVTRYEVITEPTTERRIFVPSHPKLYTSIDYKPELTKLAESRTEAYKSESSTTQKSTSEATTQTTSTSETTKATKTSFTKSKLALPVTSAKLNKLVSKRVSPPKETLVVEEENYPVPFKPLNINLKDVLGFLNSENEPQEKVSDGPLRMSIDLDTIPDNLTLPSSSEPSTTKSPPSFSSTEPSSTLTTTSTEDSPKLKQFSAKEEIQEILKDPQGKERLAKILEARNMTIEELIDQRERGSSQLHLADIFHNKTKEPEPLEEAFEGRVSSEVFTSFPVFVRQPKALMEEEITTQKVVVASSSSSNNILVTAFPSFKIHVPKDLTKEHDSSKPTFPWKQLYPDLFNVQDKNKEDLVVVPDIQEVPNNKIDFVENKIIPADILTEQDIQRLEDLDQRSLSSVSSEQLNIVDEKIHKIIKIPSGVQSAIVASLVIVGLSLIVFMTILMIFRWTQKTKTKINYCDSLKPPLFDVKPRNIKTFVTKTLDETKANYYKNNLRRMSDNVWEREDVRKDSF